MELLKLILKEHRGLVVAALAVLAMVAVLSMARCAMVQGERTMEAQKEEITEQGEDPVGDGDAELSETDKALAKLTDDQRANMFIILIMALLLQLTGFVSVVIAWVMAAARAIQIYILAAFSPIPISLLGFEQTRSMGINFLKNFAAACLAGTIMAFLLTIMPKLCATYIHVGDIVIDGTVSILPFIAPFGLPILLIIGVVKSGAWARDLFGG